VGFDAAIVDESSVGFGSKTQLLTFPRETDIDVIKV
jgi:hypothetical protein